MCGNQKILWICRTATVPPQNRIAAALAASGAFLELGVARAISKPSSGETLQP
jgi:hypothetical protein